MTPTRSITEEFEQGAAQHAATHASLFDSALRDIAITKAYLRPDMTVADLDCGDGAMAAALAPLVRQVIILDHTAEALEQARHNLADHDNVIYQQVNGGESLPLAEMSVDAVFAHYYLRRCEDPQAAIREMARVLRPGGRLVITDLEDSSPAGLAGHRTGLWQGFDRQQVKDWLRQAGLVNRIVESAGQYSSADLREPPGKPGEIAPGKVSTLLAVAARPLAGMREQVRQRYGARAEGKGGSCCAPQADLPVSGGCCAPQIAAEETSSCCAPNKLAPAQAAIAPGYSAEQTHAVPEEAAEIALGCGNPTALARLRPGEVVVDIGSGGGLDAILAGKAVGPAGRVIGVDMTPQMLARARAAAAKAGLEKVEFRAGQAEALPLDDASADVVISNCVINLTEDKGLAFEEAFRVLRPGGRLEISDIVSDHALPLDLVSDPVGWAECVSGALPEGEYLDLIRQAGFSGIRARRSSFDRLGDVKIYSLAVSALKPGAGS